MKNNIKTTLLGVLTSSVLILTGCTTDSMVNADNTTHPIPIDLSQYKDQYEACPEVTQKAVLECNEQDGVLRKEGMMGCYMCVVTFSDAGNSCQDNSECEGECRAIQGEFAPAGTTNQTGECQKNSSPFGCYQTIENGVLQPALCVD